MKSIRTNITCPPPPAIQRKFVWREEKICTLFDSIMRDYPIGTFLFWELDQGNANDYTFYEFLKKLS
ncbi:DUF262 domain-containing protein [Vibrio parahaemolyticus]|uniref:DUF262 domain-containing protein n=1 Tax=Vibrio parahaemolyticus TaxID=670 RepID=UPI00214B5BAC|nr:DUF262 domain-containing protein [Vibrio parahaemolyticus]